MSHETTCKRCSGSGEIAISAITGLYRCAGPVPDDARGVAASPCYECTGSGETFSAHQPLARFCSKCGSECTNSTFWSNSLRTRYCFTCAEVALVEMLDASKGGNVRGITEDHRFVMCDELKEVRASLNSLTSSTDSRDGSLCDSSLNNPSVAS